MNLRNFYRQLLDRFGPRNWWPGDTPEEVIVGAILTQNTNWINVEKAIAHLRVEGALDFRKLSSMNKNRVAELIRPAGYFNQKAMKLAIVSDFFLKNPPGKMSGLPITDAREKLLSLWGVGEETADSILLYALDFPILVVDAYTRRIFHRHGLWGADIPYGDMQKRLMKELKGDTVFYNDFHAQIVELGKNHCRKSRPSCADCPVPCPASAAK
ncbi:MAG: endonuclease III domain-containing protein [Candidatus Wallbacteria bacterium]|nr:endonuclease III domain-containing protein [Candidatus Wallbacteria bacterium]